MSSSHLFAASTVPFAPVGKVQFSVWDPEELKGYSMTQKLQVRNQRQVPAGITDHNSYNGDEAIFGGLADPRLGNIQDREHCGYFGHIELARPVYHVGFLNTVLSILRSVSYYDGKLLFEPTEGDKVIWEKIQRLKGKKRLGALAKVSAKYKECRRNKQPLPKYRKEGLEIIMTFDEKADETLIPGTGERKQVLTALHAFSVLKKIPDADARLMGLNPKFARPEWLILTVFPVPPPHVRPSVSMGGTRRCQDDLTHKLSDIVKANTAVKNGELNGDSEHVMEQYVRNLQFHCATFVDNQLAYQPQATQKGGKPLKTLRQRLVGKEGRVRGNLMGKRVNFSARTVITADPNLSIDQVGVPLSIARNLTVPERVTSFNIERLKKLVENGPDNHPGANYICKDDNTSIDLRYTPLNDIMLKRGWIVERHLSNDDVVLFNRQPSLHKMSIMGHRVRVMYWSTFRMNLSVTSPYNADFDGDEMNLHVPQSLTARAEAETMMMVNKVIVSPQSNRPVMGIVQDSLLSSWRLTTRDIFLNKNELYNLLMWVDDFDGNVPPPAIMVPQKNKPGQYHALWTGKQMFSTIIPDGVNLNGKANHHPKKKAPKWPSDLNPEDSIVLIQDGQIITGIIDKAILGAKAGGLIHTCFNEFGPEVTRVLMNQIQKISNHFILHFGFTVGVGDTVADDVTLGKVRDILQGAKDQVAVLVKKGQRGDLKVQPGRTMQESFEDHVNICLNTARDDAGHASVESLTTANNFKATVTSGSKGSFINISQIMACVGQQNVEGQRIPYGFRHRTLPHFYKDDLGPESRGFVENSYLKGLSPQEFYFHAMGGREGLIDTACKTAETGYIQRRLVKALEDVMVKYDGTVRNGRGDIIQFLYGEDGMDGAFVETQNLTLLSLSKADMKRKFHYEPHDLNFGYHNGRPYMEAQYIQAIKSDSDVANTLRGEALQLEKDQKLLRTIMYEREPGGVMTTDSKLVLPVNLKRMIWNLQMMHKIDLNKTSDLDPIYIAEKVYALIARLVVVDGEDELSQEAQENATTLFKILLRSTLASKVVLVEHRLTKLAFDQLIGLIEARFFKSMVNPGEMCGVLAAQSIGEPATQMTLNTFHFAGVSAKNVTLGVPRLKEIINGAKNVKTPSVTVYLDEKHRRSDKSAAAVMARLEYTRLRELAEETSVIFDPNIENTIVNEDFEFVQGYWEMPDDESISPSKLSPWVLRIVARKDLMRFKGITNAEILQTIRADFGGEALCICNDENEDKCVLRIRLIAGGDEDDKDGEVGTIFGVDEFIFLRRMENELLDNLRLRGVHGIKKVYIRENDKLQVWNPDTGSAEASKEFILDTDGSNLLAVLSQRGVDHTRTVSNDCIEVWNTLGAEALRRSLLNEIRAVISFDGSYVNYRHLSILVDVMAQRGELCPVTRHGINRAESGPLQRCSFEETVEILMDAAAFAEMDPLASVSENILLGQLAPLGTGHFSLYLNEEMLKDAIEHEDENEEDYDDLGAAGASSPLGPLSPSMSPSYSQFSPQAGNAEFLASPEAGGFSSPAPASPPQYAPASPSYNHLSPTAHSPSYSPTSPGYSPASPSFSPSSPAYSPSSPAYSPSSPAYSPSSPAYSPSSPAYSPSSPAYSPSSPAYSPSSPAYAGGDKASGNKKGQDYSPSSPAYSPSSPAYSPSSPAYSPSSPAYSPSSPAYSPSSPAYSPSSPAYSPAGGSGGGAGGAYSPSSPAYSPSSPAYSPSSPAYSPSSPAYSPSSPAYGDEKKDA